MDDHQATTVPVRVRLPKGTKVRALAAGKYFSFALTATACDDSSSPGGTAGSAATRAVDTAHGKATVPAHPLRIVSVHSWSTESLYDLLAVLRRASGDFETEDG